jgi:site-specific recombinase XerD
VLAIPTKRAGRNLIGYLERPEIDALLAAPDRTTRLGRRDHLLLLVAVQTGLRVSELTNLRRTDIHLGVGAHLSCTGKGHKQRATPLFAGTVTALRAWLDETSAPPDAPIFPGPRGGPLNRDSVNAIIARHAATAATACPSIAAKRITAHVLRHSCAMELFHAGVDITTIALWLGHEGLRTTNVYVTADLHVKEQALARISPPGIQPGRYRPPDRLLAFLEAL